MHQTRALIEARGFDVICGDTDSTFVWLKGAHAEEDAVRIGRELVAQVNQWWQTHLRESMNLDCALELQFEVHYRRFLMPTIRGTDEGSKKRYADSGSGLMAQKKWCSGPGIGAHRLVTAGPAVSAGLYARVFRGEPYRDYLCDYVQRTLAGENDELLVYQALAAATGRLSAQCPAHVRAARLADDYNKRLGRPLQYQRGGWISYVITTAGPEPLENLQAPSTMIITSAGSCSRWLMPSCCVGDDFARLIDHQLLLF